MTDNRSSAGTEQADLERLYRITWTLHGGLPFTRFCELRNTLMLAPAQAAPNRECMLERAISEACDLLAERTYGSPARSPGHNARLRLEQALVAQVYAALPPAAPVDLRRDVIELREWKAAIIGKCKASDGFDALEWGGDKEGWGFIHYFIGHLETRALEAEAQVRAVPQTVAEPSDAVHFGNILRDEAKRLRLRANELDPSDHEETPDFIPVPKAALTWLFGEGAAADGKTFGEDEDVEIATPRKYTRRYWWRSRFRSMIPTLAVTRPQHSTGES